MGQNANTGLAQIVAEELNIDVDDIEGVLPNTGEVPPLAVTAASMSLTAFSRPTAIAAATLRESMRERAAANLSETAFPPSLTDAGGFRTADDRRVSYADLLEESSVMVEFDESQTASPPLYTIRHRPREETGWTRRETFGHPRTGDRRAGLCRRCTHARHALLAAQFSHPVRNARIASLDTSGVAGIEGVVELVLEGDFVGVVCQHPQRRRCRHGTDQSDLEARTTDHRERD